MARASPVRAMRASRAVCVAQSRHDIIASMVPEGAEDNVDALQRATERLETDALRTRRDLLVFASRVLRDGCARADGGEADTADARVIAALVELVPTLCTGTRETNDANEPRLGFRGDERDGDRGDENRGDANEDERGENTQRSRIPRWASSSNCGTKKQDSEIARAAFRVKQARARRDEVIGRTTRRATAVRCEEALVNANLFLTNGDFENAAAAIDECFSSAKELSSAIAVLAMSKSSALVGEQSPNEESQRKTLAQQERDHCASLTNSASAAFGKLTREIRDAFENAVVASDPGDADELCVLAVRPLILESIWRVLSTTPLKHTKYSEELSELTQTLLHELNDLLAFKLFLPLVDAAVEDGRAVTAHFGGDENTVVTFRARIVCGDGDTADRDPFANCDTGMNDPSATATSLARALEVALRFTSDALKLAGRLEFADSVLGSTWNAVASAIATRWFEVDNSGNDTQEATQQKLPGNALSDDAVASLCAAEAAASQLGASPAFPAVGPVESGAFDLERRAARATHANTLGLASTIVDAGELSRFTLRVKGNDVSSDSIEVEVETGFGDELGFAENAGAEELRSVFAKLSGADGAKDFAPFNAASPFPACTISQAAMRLSVLATATLARGFFLRNALNSERAAVSNAETVSPHQKNISKRSHPQQRAQQSEASTLISSACDVLEYWRAVVPVSRRGCFVNTDEESDNNENSPAAAIVKGGPVAAVTFRNDAFFLAQRFSEAVYVWESKQSGGFDNSSETSAESRGTDNSVTPEEEEQEEEEAQTHDTKQDALLWVVPPLVKLGDDVVCLLMRATVSEIETELTILKTEFTKLGDSNSSGDALRAVRRARRALGSVCAALTRGLPAPLGNKLGGELLSKYAERIVTTVFSLPDVSASACDALHEILREAFSVENLFPPRGTRPPNSCEAYGVTQSSSSGDRKPLSLGERKIFAANEANELIQNNPTAASLWRKGKGLSQSPRSASAIAHTPTDTFFFISKAAFLPNLFHAPLTHISEWWQRKELQDKGFTKAEIRGLVTAVFKNSDRREGALASFE